MKVGYLSQHAEELGAGGPPGQSVLDAAQRATGLTPNKARALLGQFLFSGEEAEKPLAGLSGASGADCSLAVLVHSGANVLILDEPTNHLDIESREALEDALQAFQGAVLLVSHDRALLDAVGTRTVAVEGSTLRSYEGGWPEYVRVREERRAAGEALDGSGSSNGHLTNRPTAEQNGAESAKHQAQSQAEGPVEESPQRPAKGGARDRSGGDRAARGRGRPRRPGGMGDQVRVGQVRGPPYRGATRSRGRLHAPGSAGGVGRAN